MRHLPPAGAALLACATVSLALLAAPTASAKVQDERIGPRFQSTSHDYAAPVVSRAAESVNPLANRPWGVYKGSGDQAWLPYTRATGKKKKLLGKIALAPKSKWYGGWIPDNQIEAKIRDHIANAQAGNPETLVNMSIFRMSPWEEEACKRLPTRAEQKSYKQWIDSFARGVGEAHAAIVLQPDGPFALCAPGGSLLPSQQIGYAARVLGALPNASVYIDAGASDWLRSDPARALQILLPASVADVRGFALNSTHYAATSDELRFGAAIVAELEKLGITDKHFVVNTAANGRPFNGYEYRGSNHYDNANVCKTRSQQRCVTLGIPPTADVANPRWGLSVEDAALAARYADGYVWVGRPWLYMQADPFDMKRALAVARTTPY